ncbi:HNH endonuclease [Puteibacter caeruleilacunae]|nr:HNH endonuclease [Puteibacter caeruleilacunae]
MQQIVDHITSLRQGTTKYGKAPHKPILLLAVIDCFEKGYFFRNSITITEELVTSFHDHWRLLVHTGHDPNFALPFFHLRNERSEIWQLQPKFGQIIPQTKSNSIKSFKALKESVFAAHLSDDLFYSLLSRDSREQLKSAILEKYFPEASTKLLTISTPYSEQIRQSILYEPNENYVRTAKHNPRNKKDNTWIEEQFVRGHIFRKAVLEQYKNTCTISKMKVEFNNTSIIDACHIIPYAETYDCSITNGIALSPTLHRAFDRGLIAIDDNYRVVISKRMKDYNPDVGIEQYSNKQILLPSDDRFYPSLEKLKHHRTSFGF